jgi:hypothetical protein
MTRPVSLTMSRSPTPEAVLRMLARSARNGRVTAMKVPLSELRCGPADDSVVDDCYDSFAALERPELAQHRARRR